MLSGEYRHQCDDKFRLRLPSKLKKEFANGYYVTKGNDGCLYLLSQSELDNIMNKVNNLPLFSKSLQQPLRVLFSSAFEPQEDYQGRFLLPTNLREYAQIKKDVVKHIFTIKQLNLFI